MKICTALIAPSLASLVANRRGEAHIVGHSCNVFYIRSAKRKHNNQLYNDMQTMYRIYRMMLMKYSFFM